MGLNVKNKPASLYIGNSPPAKKINRAIRKYAKVDKNVLIIGESGTGKKFTAQKIHEQSARAERPFVVIQCAGLGKNIGKKELFGYETKTDDKIERIIGLIERANKGVIYLDNIAEIPSEYQADLWRLISEKKYRRIGGTENLTSEVRIISSCEKSLESEVDSSDFRKDFYYTLKALTITIPPLKERKQDIPELFIYFLKHYCVTHDIEVPAVPVEIFESILEYDWNGNIHELKNCVENLVMMSQNGELSSRYLPFEIKRHPLDFMEVKNLNRVISDVEIYLIRKALGKFAGNQVKAARLLGIPEATLRFKIKKYAISKEAF